MGSPTDQWTDSEWTTFSDWIKGVLKMTEVTVTFTKKDGTERIMRCTLDPVQLPASRITENTARRKVNQDVIAVYDLDSQGWRSFSVKSVKQVNFDLG